MGASVDEYGPNAVCAATGRLVGTTDIARHCDEADVRFSCETTLDFDLFHSCLSVQIISENLRFMA